MHAKESSWRSPESAVDSSAENLEACPHGVALSVMSGMLCLTTGCAGLPLAQPAMLCIIDCDAKCTGMQTGQGRVDDIWDHGVFDHLGRRLGQ